MKQIYCPYCGQKAISSLGKVLALKMRNRNCLSCNKLLRFNHWPAVTTYLVLFTLIILLKRAVSTFSEYPNLYSWSIIGIFIIGFVVKYYTPLKKEQNSH